MVRMKDVAEYANVSVATVSRYINKSGYISQEASKKVQEAIDYLNYTPNEVARSLYKKQSKFIGLLIPDITNPFFTMLARGVEDKLKKSDYSLILANVDDDEEKEKEYLSIFKQNNIAGILSAISPKNKLSYDKIHTVEVDRVSESKKYSVYSDDFQGGALAAAEIIKRKPKEVLIFVSTDYQVKSVTRAESAVSVLEKHNITYHIQTIQSFKLGEAKGLYKNISKKYPNIDSIIAANDIQALVLLKEIIGNGKKVPEDIQIIGYDDVEYSKLSVPGLSTISQPIYEMGQIGAEMLLDVIQGKEIKEKQVVLPVHFVDRGSLRKIE